MPRPRSTPLLALLITLASLGAAASAAPASAAGPGKWYCAVSSTVTMRPGLSPSPSGESYGMYGSLACAHKPAAPPIATGAFAGLTFSPNESCDGGISNGVFSLAVIGPDGSVFAYQGRLRMTRTARVVVALDLLPDANPGTSVVGTLNGLLVPTLNGLCVADVTQGGELVAAGALKESTETSGS